MKKRTRYYIVAGYIVVKKVFGKEIVDYCFDEGEWEEALFWKDDSNKPDSVPLKGDNLCELGSNVEEITEELAMEIIVDQTLSFLKTKWEKDFAEEKKEWEKSPRWPAKLVETGFKLYGVERKIVADDLPESLKAGTPYLDGFFESIQRDIEEDLRSYGAEITFSFGLMD